MVLDSPTKRPYDYQRLRELERERQVLKRHIRAVDIDIHKMTDKEKGSKYEKYVNISGDVEACEQAQKLVTRMMHDKKALEKRRQES